MTERNNLGPEEELEGRGTQTEESGELEKATHEAEAHVEETRGHKEAEVVEGLVKDLVEGSQETVDQTQPPGVSDQEVEKIKDPDEGDQATPINLPSPESLGSTAEATPINTPKPVPPDALEGGTVEATPINTPYPVPPEASTKFPPQLTEEEIARLKQSSDTGEVVDFKSFKKIPALDGSSKGTAEATPINTPKPVPPDLELKDTDQDPFESSPPDLTSDND